MSISVFYIFRSDGKNSKYMKKFLRYTDLLDLSTCCKKWVDYNKLIWNWRQLLSFKRQYCIQYWMRLMAPLADKPYRNHRAETFLNYVSFVFIYYNIIYIKIIKWTKKNSELYFTLVDKFEKFKCLYLFIAALSMAMNAFEFSLNLINSLFITRSI